MENFMSMSIQKGNIENTNAQSKSKIIGKYLILSTIGKGKYKVKRALDVTSTSPDNIVALKLFRKYQSDPKDNFAYEKAAYSKFKHKNTLKMLDYYEDFHYINQKGNIKHYNILVLEYASKGDLFTYLQKSKNFDEKISRNLFSQILEGLLHIHNNGYAHLDIKLENIYFDENYQLKIADFDLSRPMEGRDFTPRRVGSINYMAPEIIEGRFFDGIKSDIFALGVLLFCIIASRLPFASAKSSDPWYKHIINKDFDTFWELHSRRGIVFKPALKALIAALLSYDPQQRPTIADIKLMDWMKENNSTPEEYEQEMKKRYSKVKCA